MILKLQGADGMRNSLDRVLDRMREVIHRIDAPFVSGIVMRRVRDAVNDRVSEVDVRRRHVNLGTKYLFAVRVFAGPHFLKQREIFLHAAISVRTLLTGFR